ncbi:MAG: response regulator transcription factor [Actinobacteria bacterium]|nr:response regulator transcription factor [Actinomycetota bacterium]
MDLMVNGLTVKQIASELGISLNTVKTHIKNIYRKLDVNCRSRAILKLTGYSTPTPTDLIERPKD